jgi:hypothetical protein
MLKEERTMRNVLLVLIVAALALPAFAKEIELAPYLVEDVGGGSGVYAPYDGAETRTESEYYWDDGVDSGAYFPGSLSPYATTFTATADCHLVTYKIYWYGGGNIDVNCLLYDDDGGGDPQTPTGSTLFTITGNSGTASFAWFEVDVTSAGATLTNGQIFHPGWSHTASSQGVLMDTAKGGYSCWLWLGSWYDYSSYYTHMVRVIVDDDMDPPYVDEQDPADGGAGAPDTEIVFHCKDDDYGVDSETIDFMAEDETRGEVSGSLDIDDGDANDVVCTFTPDSDLPEGTITCTVAGTLADGLTNEMGDDAVWSFVVDATPPTITQEYPTGGRAGGGVPVTRSAVGGGATVVRSTVSEGYTRTAGPDTNIGWHIEDNAAGCLFEDCIYSVKVGGVDVPVAENITDDGTTDVTVELDPDSDFNPGDVVDVSVQAADLAGNTMPAAYEWSFTVGYVNVKDSSVGAIKATYR